VGDALLIELDDAVMGAIQNEINLQEDGSFQVEGEVISIRFD